MIKLLDGWRGAREKGSGADLPLANFDKLASPGHVPASTYLPATGQTQWYPAPLLGAQTLADRVLSGKNIRATLALMKSLNPDDYVAYLIRYFECGLDRFGDDWRYADIVTVLMGLADTLKPRRYLEIGVRRGRSVCAVASKVPTCDLVLFDKWVKNYAGIDNPGPEFVQAELKRIGHRGTVECVNGNSHQTLPAYFARNPDATFDLMTVDGDHSDQGAAQDIADVLPHLAIGGAIVFDDICHPKHLSLRQVWNDVVVSNHRMSSWMFDDTGYGVAFALRKW